MTAPFECEVRFPVADIEAFHDRLRALGARVAQAYAFTDYYHQPAGTRWDPRTRALRIREHHEPPQGSELLLTEVEILDHAGLPFKRSRFPEGKVRLYAGTREACAEIARGLGFVPWMVVPKRDGRLFAVPSIGELVTEYVDPVGWMCEVEQDGADPEQAAGAIRRTLDILGIDSGTVTADPVAAIVAKGLAADARPARSLRVYFCGAIRGGRDRQPLYRAIVDFLGDRGYEVLTTHVASVDVLQEEWRDDVTAHDIYTRDLRWLAECDLVIAEVSTPSLGVGVEITEAQHLSKPVIALCQQDVSLSAMIAGNSVVRLIRYTDADDLFARLSAELQDSPPHPSLSPKGRGK